MNNTRQRRPSATACRSQEGATAVEYALIATVVAAAIVGAVLLLGEDLGRLYERVAAAMP